MACSEKNLFVKYSYVREIKESDFTELINRAVEVPVLLYQYANWCPHCDHNAPLLNRLCGGLQELVICAGIDCADEENNNFCSKPPHEVSYYPTMRLFHQQQIDLLEPSSDYLAYPQGCQKILSLIDKTRSCPLEISISPHLQFIIPRFIPTYEQRRDDAYFAALYILTQIIPNQHAAITPDLYNDIMTFLNILSQAFPDSSRRRSFKNMIEILRTSWQHTTNLFLTFKDDKMDILFSCQNFPCRLWQLFHILILSGYSNPHSESLFSPYDILLFTYQTVDKFFPCDECRKNYRNHFEGMKFRQDITRDEAAIWLAQVHNNVTMSVKHEIVDKQFDTKEIIQVLYQNYWRNELIEEIHSEELVNIEAI